MEPKKIDPKEYYKPEIKIVEDIIGITVSAAKKGENVDVAVRNFLTSFDASHAKMITQAVSLFTTGHEFLNSLLVVIRNNEARIYRRFPFGLNVRPKQDIKAMHMVFKNQILDIEGVFFKDDYFNLDINDGDKFLWLFRNEWNFGLYYDFSKKLKVKELFDELGNCYKKLEYYSVYSFFSDSVNADALLASGWFPFVQLVNDKLEQLIAARTQDLQATEESILESFSKERILNFTKYWWRNKIFLEKRKILTAGIDAYIAGDEASIINCIKNLTPEIEGIIRIDFHRTNGRDPNTKELKEYILAKANRKFSDADSLGFPGLFFDYLDKSIFKGFDLKSGDVTLSRHSVGHGVASDALFTKTRALQLILTLDQIYFYLGHDVNPGNKQ